MLHPGLGFCNNKWQINDSLKISKEQVYKKCSLQYKLHFLCSMLY